MALTRKTLVLLGSGITLFGLGFATHYLSSLYFDTTVSERTIREHGKYTYIAPLLFCGATERKDFGPYAELNQKVQTIIDNKIKSGAASAVSVFFRDTKGRWVGINDNEPFAPASLLKVPLMIAYFKAAENDQALLDRRFTYEATNLNALETFISSSTLKAGASYSIDELISSMIVDSDNNATALLYTHIDPATIDEVYTDLGLAGSVKKPFGGDMSSKTFTYFLRALYNATYLTPQYSEKALALLSRSHFSEGLRSGVPSTITIASKYGERTEGRADGMISSRTLSDCGIVYANSPYFLCIMTKGQNFKDLSQTIKDISTSVYREVTANQ